MWITRIGVFIFVAIDEIVRGSFGEPAGKAGVADLTAELMRTGGTATRDPNTVDEEIDFLAAYIFKENLWYVFPATLIES